MLAASSNSTINPSSTTLSSTVNPSIASNFITNPSTTTSRFTVNSSIASNYITNPSTNSSFTVKPPSTASSQFGFLSPKPSSSYQVTENVIDIPDDRTLPPIATNFGLFKPLNVANTTINVIKVIKNDTGDENNDIKKTYFVYIHFTKGTEQKKEGGITKLFKGIRDYVFNFKKGVVDGLHGYFHKDDKKKDKEGSYDDTFLKSKGDFDKNDEVDFHHKFHRSYHSDENFDDYAYDEFENGAIDLKG